MRASNWNPKLLSARRVGAVAAVLLLSAGLPACGSEDEGTPRGNPGGTTFDASVNPVATADTGAPASAPADAGSGSGVKPATDSGAPTAPKDAGGSTTTPMNDASAQPPAGDAAAPAGDGGGMVAAGGACTREVLAAAVDSYYKALTAHDPKMINASPMIKLTEDGKTIMLGEGLMKTAGMVKFKRSGLDTLQCETVTESVVAKGSDDYVVGTRLKVSGGQISEVESILVGPDGWFPNPKAIIDGGKDDWEKPLLAEADRMPRDKLKKDIVDGYFVGVFGGKIPVADFPFASDCKRAENGFSPGACNFGVPTSMPMTPRHYVVDVEAGIVAGFVLFGGRSSGMDDFHMFRVKAGKVAAVHAVVGPSVSSRGWPDDPANTP